MEFCISQTEHMQIRVVMGQSEMKKKPKKRAVGSKNHTFVMTLGSI
jgi:hypothetical protein